MNNEAMPNFLTKRAFLTPDRTAIYFENQSLTFKELYNQSIQTAGKLQKKGVSHNDYVGVLLKSNLDTVILLYAFHLLGVKTVMLNNRLSPAELTWQINNSNSRYVLMDDSFSEIGTFINEQLPDVKIITSSGLFAGESIQPNIIDEIDLNDTCTIMYTSGTTGHPKGVIQSYGNHWWSAIGSALNLGITETDCWLCNVPLFHISGYSILMKSVIYGMPIVLHEHFDAEKVIQDIGQKEVTIMSVVGTSLSRIVNTLENRSLPSQFRCMLLGGGPAPLPLLEACVEKNIPVYQTYGMTETSSQIVTLSPEYSLSKLGSAGKPLFPSQLKIELEDKTTASANQHGEIVVKGPNVTKGYLNRPDATAEKIKDGWLNTGDIGYLDEDGFLYVLDRRSDLIISGGENIYPAEIEAVLLAHPDVLDAGVTGIEDSEWGQVPAAFIVKKPGSVLSAEQLQDFCLQRLAKYKLPKTIYFTEELPRNAAKKLLRRNLRDWIGAERR